MGSGLGRGEVWVNTRFMLQQISYFTYFEGLDTLTKLYRVYVLLYQTISRRKFQYKLKTYSKKKSCDKKQTGSKWCKCCFFCTLFLFISFNANEINITKLIHYGKVTSVFCLCHVVSFISCRRIVRLRYILRPPKGRLIWSA